MKKERKEDNFIKQPYYKGGDKAMKEFIQAHLRYPVQSQTNKIEGDVYIRYDINHKGEVIDTKIIGGLDDACNEEAVRVVNMLRFIVPKTPRHLKVTFHKNIRIHFQINEMKNEPTFLQQGQGINTNQAMQIKYNVVSNHSKSIGEKQNQPISYTYVVKI